MQKKSGQFTTLQNITYLRHGFSVGYPSVGFPKHVNTPETIQAHTRFLQDYGMEPYQNVLIMRADGTPYVFLEDTPAKDPDVPFFASIRAECVISSIKGYSINIKLADCAGFLGTVVAKDGTELLLILHGSRNTLANKFWMQAIQAAQEKYGFDPSEIKGGVTPHICVQCHTLQHLDALPNADEWREKGIVVKDANGLWHFDSTALLKKQLKDAGVNLNNVEIDTRCTYEEYVKDIKAGRRKQEDGTIYPFVFSHRAYNDHHEDPQFYEGRFVLAGMLKKFR